MVDFFKFCSEFNKIAPSGLKPEGAYFLDFHAAF